MVRFHIPVEENNRISCYTTIEKAQDTVYLKEISAPQGYVLDTKSYGVKLEVGKTVQIEVTDREQLASLTVYKEGEVLTGAEVTGEGVTFSYTKEKQEGAVYDVYAEKEIVRADGTVAYKKGAVVKKGLKTGEDGSVTLSELPLGTYKVVEVKAPENFVCKGESQTVTLSYAGQNEEVVFEIVTFVNDRQKASVSVRKEDQDTENPLAGGIYGLYTAEDVYGKSEKLLVEKDTLIEKVTTGENGTASYQADLPIGYTYYIKELQAPAQYVKNETEKFSFHFQYVEGEEQCSFSHTFQNARVKAEIVLEKEDAETGKTPQGDASLKGAVYGLYARENIVHPDGKTGVLYQKDEQVATLKTDDKGKAEVKDLYLGSYYIKEITPPAGYLLDETEHDVICDDEGDTVAIVKRVCNVKEQVKKQPFQLIKAGNNGNTDAELLKGAGFQAYLESSLKKKEDGSYDFASATPVVIGENGATELFTDERGYACSIPLPYGTYGYVMLQKISEGYEYIIYDQAFREIGGQFYENITASKEEVVSWIFREEGMGELPCEPFSYEELKKSVIEGEKKRLYEGELASTSQIDIREEELLHGESRQNIEESVLCYAQAELEEAGYEEITLLAARVYGSRTRETLYREDSDLDVVLSYTGDIREDVFFNLLQENGIRIAGLKIDINPISLEKTGTLQEYMKRAEQYLDEREVEKQGRTPQETVQEPKISFYAAECMEFPSMGEYYENLTLEEAVEKYKTIPEDRIHGIKGIGFCLEDGSIYDGEYELMSGGKISKDLIDLVPHYKESPLVQKAMRDLERILAEKQRENTAEQAKPEGTMGRKVSVLKALKERKELLKKQEKKEETSHTRKKEAEL